MRNTKHGFFENTKQRDSASKTDKGKGRRAHKF